MKSACLGHIFLPIAFLLLFLLPSASRGEESSSSSPSIRFERMWPTLQDPWYFSKPRGVASDSEGNIYVVDYYNHCVHKFSAGGQFITKWGKEGGGNGEFKYPRDIAAAPDNTLYVTDSKNHRVQKFDLFGRFLGAWGAEGKGNGQFATPAGITSDQEGNLYVVDSQNCRVQKFDGKGTFLTKWGSEGDGDAFFGRGEGDYGPEGIATDGDGNIYVADTANHRIQKFDAEGGFLGKWGGNGNGDGRFSAPSAIAVRNRLVYVLDSGNGRIQEFTQEGEYRGQFGKKGGAGGEFAFPFGMTFDSSGNAYIADSENNRIQKLALSGTPGGFLYLGQWRSGGADAGFFQGPSGLAVDSDGNVHVCDTKNHRIQKFDSLGRFIMAWGSRGGAAGQFLSPSRLALDSNNALYVADTANHRIQKFDAQGAFIIQWGGMGRSNGKFLSPQGIAVDSRDNVYIADLGNNRIQKFSADGIFITAWGKNGSGDGEFDLPMGVGIGGDDVVYVADSWNDRVQKFSSDGVYLGQWGGSGAGPGSFFRPYGVAVGANGDVHVADSGNNRIQIFSREGDFLAAFGEFGLAPGQMNTPYDVTLGADGMIYVADHDNNRIEAFRLGEQPGTVSKAIIVAGGGPYPGNSLWDATQKAANNAYWTLYYKGFTKENIAYLSANTTLDLDQNGIADDIDGEATNADLLKALRWARDADELILYLVDHGGRDSFRMSDKEILPALDLSLWLDELQANGGPDLITIVYDACRSGGFIQALVPPEGKSRITIASAAPEESAYFVTQGAISFSSFFWTNILNGLNIHDAFLMARNALGHATEHQNPVLDDNGNGMGNETADGALAAARTIGNRSSLDGGAPIFDGDPAWERSGENGDSLDLYVHVHDVDGISRVWALVRPPDFSEDALGSTVRELPFIDLLPAGGNKYVADHSRLSASGLYQTALQGRIAVYAQNSRGNTAGALMKASPEGGGMPRSKAVIIAGGTQVDPLFPAVRYASDLAHNVLSFQGYAPEDIFFLRADLSPAVDGMPTVDNVRSAIKRWAPKNSRDLVVYLVGEGCPESFVLDGGMSLSAEDLASWLNELQSGFGGKVTLVYDAPFGGAFLARLVPPPGKDRILIASASSHQKTHFLAGGALSFSSFFWKNIFDGMSVRKAFTLASEAIPVIFGGMTQTPLIDDNGNGIVNEKSDGELAATLTLGMGIKLAGERPIIGSVFIDESSLADSGAVTISVSGVTSTGIIDKVWAVITPPGLAEDFYPKSCDQDYLLPVITLRNQDDMGRRFEGEFDGLTDFGAYRITVYAQDKDGNISLPHEADVFRGTVPDGYIDDESFATASMIIVNNPVPQLHNFDREGDQDWVLFHARAGEIYTVRADRVGKRNDVVIELYDRDGARRLAAVDGSGPGADEELSWKCPEDGVYYVMARHAAHEIFGPETEYALKVFNQWALAIPSLNNCIMGRVVDGQGNGISGAVVRAGNASNLSLESGYFILPFLESKQYEVTISKDGYEGNITANVTVPGSGQLLISLKPSTPVPSDRDGDGIPDAMDAFPDDPTEHLDTDNDGVGDNTDPDDDNDGMPDEWEMRFISLGMQPLVPDHDEDFDADGITNIEEYKAGTDPGLKNSIIAGRVVDGEGKGVGRIVVEARSAVEKGESYSAATDMDGIYRLPVARDQNYHVIAWQTGSYQTVYYDQAILLQDASLVDASAGNVQGIDFVLNPGFTISGMVTNLAPGDRAIIEAWSPSAESWGGVVLTGMVGPVEYAIHGLAQAADYEITVRAVGYGTGYLGNNGEVGPWERASRFEAGGKDVNIALVEGYSLSGSITGLPPGQKATITARNENSGYEAAAVITASGEPEKDTYVIDGLLDREADYRVALWTDSHGGGYWSETIADGTNLVPHELASRINMGRNDFKRIDFFLVKGGTIRGTVFGLAKGESAIIDARSATNWCWGATTVIGDGSRADGYAISGLRDADDYFVRIWAVGYQGGYYSDGGTVVHEYEADKVDPSVEEKEIDFLLEKGVTLSGTITGLAKGQVVHLQAWSESKGSWGGTTVFGNGESVAYAITGLPVSADYQVLFRPEGHAEERLTGIDIGIDRNDIDFAVSPGRVIAGEIINGPPKGIVRVAATSRSGGSAASINVLLDGQGAAGYSLKGLPEAMDYVVAVVTGDIVLYHRQRIGAGNADQVDVVGRDAPDVHFDLDVTRYEVTGEITGLVDKMTEQPRNVPVRIDVWNDNYVDCLNRLGNGTFSMKLPKGSYHASLHGKGYVDAYYTAASPPLSFTMPNNAPIELYRPLPPIGELNLKPFLGYKLEGHVFWDGNENKRIDPGEALDKVFVEAVSLSGGQRQGAFSNRKGYYVVEGLADGRYDVLVWSATFSSGQKREGVIDGADQRLDIALGNASFHSFAGRVRKAASPVKDAVVLLFRKDVERDGLVFVNAVYTDKEGTFTFNGLDGSDYEIKIDENGDGAPELLQNGGTSVSLQSLAQPAIIEILSPR